MQEVKFCYQNIAISIDNSGFEVWNKNLFTSTDAFDCVALLHRDGKLYQQQKLANIDVAPEARSSFPLPFMVPALLSLIHISAGRCDGHFLWFFD